MGDRPVNQPTNTQRKVKLKTMTTTTTKKIPPPQKKAHQILPNEVVCYLIFLEIPRNVFSL